MMDQVGEACKDTPPVCAQAVHRDRLSRWNASPRNNDGTLLGIRDLRGILAGFHADDTGITPRDRSVALDKQALADRSAWDVLIRVSGRDRESCC